MPSTPALGAFDAEHFELAFDIAERSSLATGALPDRNYKPPLRLNEHIERDGAIMYRHAVELAACDRGPGQESGD